MKKDDMYFNLSRAKQANMLRGRLLRDGLGNKEYCVLRALAERMAEETKPGTIRIVDTCFPSLATLSEETMLGDRSVRRALDSLLKFNYLTKTKIPGRRLFGNEVQNKYENNRYHLVHEVWDSAVPPTKSATLDQLTSAAMTDEEQVVLDDLEVIVDRQKTTLLAPAAVAQSKAAVVAAAPELRALLMDHFGDHPSLTCSSANNIINDCINKCVAQAGGDANIAWMVFDEAFKNQKINTALTGAKLLCGYINKLFSGWLEEWRKYNYSVIDAICDGSALVLDESVEYLVHREELWLRTAIGSHLIDLTYSTDDRTFCAQITPSFKIANLLSRFTTTAIAPDSIPNSADEDLFFRARDLSTDESWRTGLRAADDAVAYLFDTLNDAGSSDDRREPDADIDSVVEFEDEVLVDEAAMAEERWLREPEYEGA